MIETYIRSVSNLSRALAIIATFLLALAMLVICEMIFVRYILRQATIWQTDFVVFAATTSIFLGAPYVLLKKGHIGVDVIEHLVGEATRRRLRLAGCWLGFVFCVIMLVASWINFHEAWVNNWTTSSVWGPPLWIPYSAVPAGFALLCLQYVAEILRLHIDANAAALEPEAEISAFKETAEPGKGIPS
ncbi:TRAP-type C4-dicarboxylate transport system permease small subunit [Mesorhizobium sp. J18]|uniref:TRAP transporter small permease subunit n=1 Tax=Mesorhizobium sp. J18 TaxID=935263 RepID=UPI001199DA7C|nr:TRAP transporter small permease [Mesorhizobium sp. J18]TWG97946.1 TRAP-type C4-dicarboxylate transport system permease small subunit [Mesorhizobium sp. J18]